MNPRLAALAGPFEGESFQLTDDELSIGRIPGNRISIVDDSSVSRHHCVIRRDDGRFVVLDLESRNCTFVNDIPVKEQVLAEGDRIRVGNSLFVFLLEEKLTPRPTSVRLDGGDIEAESTVMIPMEDVSDLRSEGLAGAFSSGTRDLAALFKISALINSISSADELGHRLLELLFEVIPAESGAILLAGPQPGQYSSVVGWERASGATGQVPVSRSVLDRVMRERAALFLHDILSAATTASSESLVAAHVESLVCVPLVLFDAVLGAVYLQTTDPRSPLEEGHARLLSAIAPIAAVALKNAARLEALETENQILRTDSGARHDMVGTSAPLRQVQRLIDRVAPSDSTVLILGESGTGKELVARAIHRSSPRASRPFVAINCAALTESLLESELFGHERGAFTGALAQKKGKLEIAAGGTVFLDEIGEMALPLQAKVLRVLQEQEFERVGGTRPIKVDLRLIAATNRNLDDAIRAGTFRKDLFYRLNVVSIPMPPLRERRDDVPLLAAYFAARCAARANRRVAGVSDRAQDCLAAYDWPGNVRELENAIERAVVLGSTDLIEADDLPDVIVEAKPAEPASPLGPASPLDYYEAVKALKKQLIVDALRDARGSYIEAARRLGMHVTYLHRLIKNLDLKASIKDPTSTGTLS